MLKFAQILLGVIFYISLSLPLQAENKYVNGEVNININDSKNFNHQGYVNNYTKLKLNSNLKYKTKNSETNFNINVFSKDRINYDNSYFQIKRKNTSFGIGSKDFNWSFSSRNSLILSSNARPISTVFFKSTFKQNYNINWFPDFDNASLEIINGITKGNNELKDAMLFGIRATYAPTKNLKLEAFRVSQWGGNDNDKSPSIITKTFFGDTNEGTNSNINQMAGIGASYLLQKPFLPLRIYGQTVGEDEAGGLPSCLIYLAGVDWGGDILNKSTTIGFEFIDTRTRFTTSKNCGPNSAYNNHNYKYSNYGVVLGHPIDTQGSSFEFFGQTSISSNLKASFSLQKLLINSDNFSTHRLAENRRKGWFNTADLTWNKNNLTIKAGISHQSVRLEKINSKKGLGIQLFTKLKF